MVYVDLFVVVFVACLVCVGPGRLRFVLCFMLVGVVLIWFVFGSVASVGLDMLI